MRASRESGEAAIVWFRKDLRLADQAALMATKAGTSVRVPADAVVGQGADRGCLHAAAWQPRWTHNRVRMTAAAFLVTHRLVSWQGGEDHFWNRVVDADLANNSAGWRSGDPDGHCVPALKVAPSGHVGAPRTASAPGGLVPGGECSQAGREDAA